MEQENFEDRLLITFENVFTDDDFKILNNYNIKTAGEFIGVVKGFENTAPVEQAGVLKESVERFKSVVPEEIIKKHRLFKNDKPMGERY